MVSGKGARSKGHQWERQIARDLREIDQTAKRNLEYQEGSGYDIDTTLPYRIQAKSRKQINFLSALQEIPENDGNIPVVAGKITGKGEYAFMKWSDFLWLVTRAHIQV